MKQKFMLKAMNKKLIKIRCRANKVGASVVVLALILLPICSFSPVTANAITYSYDTCTTVLTPTFEWRTLEFAAFLDVHFQSKKNNTYLIDEAITAFREYKKTIMQELGKFETGTFVTYKQAEALDACVRLSEKYISDAKNMLRDHVLTTSRVKEQTALLDKYKTINSKLRDMNSLIGKIVGSFAGFNNKLPAYVKDCLKK
jgi:hypothetical protein